MGDLFMALLFAGLMALPPLIGCALMGLAISFLFDLIARLER